MPISRNGASLAQTLNRNSRAINSGMGLGAYPFDTGNRASTAAFLRKYNVRRCERAKHMGLFTSPGYALDSPNHIRLGSATAEGATAAAGGNEVHRQVTLFPQPLLVVVGHV